MNWDTVKGQWKQFKGKAKEKWGQLTDDELDQIEGNRDQLVGKVNATATPGTGPSARWMRRSTAGNTARPIRERPAQRMGMGPPRGRARMVRPADE